MVYDEGVAGETYNIGGGNELNNNAIAAKVCEILDRKRPMDTGHSYSDLITYVRDRPGHDLRYAIDATKIEKELGWSAIENFDSGIEKTIDWYIDKYIDL